MKTSSSSAKVLLVCGDIATSAKVHSALELSTNGTFEIKSASHLSEGREYIARGGIVAILLTLSLPDSQGIETVATLLPSAEGIPILVLGEEGNGALTSQAVEAGASDYIPPDHFDSYSLSRAINNAVEHRIIEDARFVEQDRALVTLNSIGDAVLCIGMSGNVTYLNKVAETMTGWSCEQAIEHPVAEVFKIIDGATREPSQDPMKMAMAQDRTVGLTTNCILIRRDGVEAAIEDSAAPIHDRAGRVIGAVIVFHDVSAARAMTAQMTFAAQHDPLTNLPNRMLLNDRIVQSISLALRQNKSLAVLFMDLDGFKHINDSVGHSFGDKLLLSVSKRLISGVRHSDTVCRLGGDEFVILLSEITKPEDAETAASKIISMLETPHIIAGEELQIGASIGISVYPDDGKDADTLIRNADTAMYHAKESGRNNCQFFRPHMNEKAVARHSMETSLRRAVEREEFLLHYQPKVDLETGEIMGAEALIRWYPHTGGPIAPAQFIPIAETCGLIIPIGRWVMRRACLQARAWQDAGLTPLRIAVNVSAVELQDKHFIPMVKNILSETGLEPRFLEIELTESILMKDVTFTAALLEELKTIGVHIAVDDFGTGYSSLSYLGSFPIDTLKIDQSFVQKISSDSDDSAIVKAIISIAKSLKCLVIAEGVETETQKAYLQSQHCDWAQGFFFSEPLEALRLERLIEPRKQFLV